MQYAPLSVDASDSSELRKEVSDLPLKVNFQEACQKVVQLLFVGAFLVVFLLMVFLPNVLAPFIRPIMVGVFLLGLVVITVEEPAGLPKAPMTLMMAGLLWLIGSHLPDWKKDGADNELLNASKVIFLLLPAMTIVETIDALEGFSLVVNAILFATCRDWRRIPFIIGFLSFFLSAAIDNMTATIILVQIIFKIVPLCEKIPELEETREAIIGMQLYLCAIVLVCANSGGAWSPVGDVTTTMLWIRQKVSGRALVAHLLLPSIASIIIPYMVYSRKIVGYYQELLRLRAGAGGTMLDLEGNPLSGEAIGKTQDFRDSQEFTKVIDAYRFLNLCTDHPVTFNSVIILGTGFFSIIMIPVFSTTTDLSIPMSAMSSLALLWIFVVVWYPQKYSHECLTQSLARVDLSGILFIFGIIMGVGALNNAKILDYMGNIMHKTFEHSNYGLAIVMGLASALVDNVPLIESAMDMFKDESDSTLWHLLAYASGTGGSVLVIGSLAGVTLLNLNPRMTFLWYLSRASFPALLGFFSGLLVYKLQPWT